MASQWLLTFRHDRNSLNQALVAHRHVQEQQTLLCAVHLCGAGGGRQFYHVISPRNLNPDVYGAVIATVTNEGLENDSGACLANCPTEKFVCPGNRPWL